MLEENSNPGLIPDFFHDVIAFLIPGYTFIILVFVNLYVGFGYLPISSIEINLGVFFFITIIAYVIGRILGQLSYWLIHHKEFPFISAKKKPGPKWTLLFDENDHTYTNSFKNNVISKIESWLEKQDGKTLVGECKEYQKDDYFNLIQFYLRERFPSVALFEKKQNANLALMRSLALGFGMNAVIYFAVLWIFTESQDLVFSSTAAVWVFACIGFSIVTYYRYKLDQRYHAMYVFETFIAMKKLLKKRKEIKESVTNK